MHSDVERPQDASSDPQAPLVAQRLRDLPRELQPPFEFDEFQRRAHERRQRRAFKVGRVSLAVAALFVAVVAGVALWSRMLETPDVQVVSQTSSDETFPLLSLVERSAQVGATERWLVNLPEPAIVRVDTRITVTDLEDRIAWVDELLTSERLRGEKPRVAALQQERELLVDSLAKVRYAETLAAEIP